MNTRLNEPTSTRHFLVHCLRVYLAAETTPPGAPVAEAIDWDALLEVAAFHRVAPLLERALREQPDFGSLTQYTRSISNRSLLLTGELARLLKRLEAQAIPAIPFKGPALAVQLYGDPALRHFDDLDVLVRRENFEAAKQVVLGLGYQPREQNPFQESFTLFKGNVEIVLEVQWDMMLKDFPLSQPMMAGIWERRVALPFGGASTSTLAPEDLLFFLCLHGSRHLWARLLWICDVAQLLRRNPSLDWDALLERARVAGGRRMLFLGLSVAQNFFGASLPPQVAQAVRRDAHTSRLARRVEAHYYSGPLEVVKPWKEAAFPQQWMDSAEHGPLG